MRIDIYANKEVIIKLLKSTNTPGMGKLITYLDANGFFEAPCSQHHHLACDGGLAEHSLNVFMFARFHNDLYRLGIPVNSLTKATLLHDVCKMFNYEKRDGKWEYYHYERPKYHARHSLNIISKFIKLTALEIEMIKWHMGPYSEYYDGHKPGDFLKWSSDRNNKNKNFALFMYFCDHFSTMFLENE